MIDNTSINTIFCTLSNPETGSFNYYSLILCTCLSLVGHANQAAAGKLEEFQLTYKIILAEWMRRERRQIGTFMGLLTVIME